MYMTSDVTGRTYQAEDAVFYRNVIQSAFMLGKHDMVLLDLFVDNDGKLVFCFPRWLHKKYIQEWANRPHDNNKIKEKLDVLDDDGL